MAKKDAKSKGVLGDDPFSSLDLSWLAEEDETEDASPPEKPEFLTSAARKQSSILAKPGYFVALTRGALPEDVCAHPSVDPPLFSWLYPRGEDLKKSRGPSSKSTLPEQLPSPIRGGVVQAHTSLSKQSAAKKKIAPAEDAHLLDWLFSEDAAPNELAGDASEAVSDAEAEATLQNWLAEDDEV